MHYTELDVWLGAVELAVSIYEISAQFPGDERFGLTAQMRRAAVSIASNVAEGEGRRKWRDRAQFYLNARGSLYELQTQVVIARRLGYVGAETIEIRMTDVAKMINGSLRNLKRQEANSE